MFEPFFRVDKSRSRELGGVGLGLALVREIVIVHDGNIAVKSNPSGGTILKSFYKVSITAVTYNRLTHLLSGNSILAVIHSLKIFVGIEFFSYAEFFRPCHVVCPWSV